MPLIEVEVDGQKQRISGSYFRGEKPQFYPEDRTLERDYVIERFFMKGWAPAKPFIDHDTPIVAFGSCFAKNISNYLHAKGYNVLTKKANKAYVTSMGDGMVHTHAIRQQFEWAWENRVPKADLWVGYNHEDFGYDEEARLQTKELFDEARVFIITLGLSEIWYDEITGEVFWRQPPEAKRDPDRHKFRVASYEESLENLRSIVALIRKYRPDATILFTVSPIPLRATFRNVSCLSANAVSKSILRAAVDQVHREQSEQDTNLFYFPSYDIVMYGFDNQWTEDRRHVYPHVLTFNMMTFEHFFCLGDVDAQALLKNFRHARALDQKIAQLGHESVAKLSGDLKEARIADRQIAAEKAAASRKADRIAARILARRQARTD